MRRTACCWVWLMASVWLATGSTLESFQAEDGYEVFPAFNQSRYKLSSVLLPWAQALSLCQGDGGGSLLAVINSETEAEVYRQLLTRLTDTGFLGAWVGITDAANEGYWLTVQGSLLASAGYAKWGWDQPDQGTDHNCGSASIDALFYDDHCSWAMPFVCEKPNV